MRCEEDAKADRERQRPSHAACEVREAWARRGERRHTRGHKREVPNEAGGGSAYARGGAPATTATANADAVPGRCCGCERWSAGDRVALMLELVLMLVLGLMRMLCC